MGQYVRPILLLSVALLIIGGCITSIVRNPGKKLQEAADQGEQGRGVEIVAAKPAPPPPDKPILFQPKFTYADKTTYQGTGFFVRVQNGKVAAVTSAHFLRRESAPLLRAEWLDIRAEKRIATFSKSWGQPGSEGSLVDARPDYLLMPVEGEIPKDYILEFDLRQTPEKGERVWFPNNDSGADIGYRLVAGTVIDPHPRSPMIYLDQEIVLQSQSGSPVISQTNGKVIGTLSRGGRAAERQPLSSAPRDR